MVEILCGLLTGLGFGVEPTGRHNDGCFMAVFKVDAFRPLGRIQEGGRRVRPLPEGDAAGRGLAAACSIPARSSTGASRTAAQNGIEVEDATWYKLQVARARITDSPTGSDSSKWSRPAAQRAIASPGTMPFGRLSQ